MPDEPIINSPSPAPSDVPPPAPVAPVETPTTTPPVITPPEPVAPAPAAPVVPQPPPNPLLGTGGGTDFRSLLSKALAKIRFRKQAKLEKIMALARQQGKITNDDAQKLLRVSDATATRYLAELVKNGRLRRAGIRGGAVYHLAQ